VIRSSNAYLVVPAFFLGLEELQCHLPHMPFDPD